MHEAPHTRSTDGGESLLLREKAILAPYALQSAQTAGREHAEASHPYRGPFQRDRDRITHASAFRRLSDKTQVFTGEIGDYHRTRLTHTLEVASIARSLARALRLNEDLSEALALLHDIGHPPFGHAGESVLNERLANFGGFDHNRHALRIVRRLENPYPEFHGLNLSREVLWGQEHRAGAANRAPLLEVQVVEIADNIAYGTHDADDAMEIGLLALDDLLALPLWKTAMDRVQKRFAGVTSEPLRRAVLRELIDWQVSDVIAAAKRRIERIGVDQIDPVGDVPFVITPSLELAAQQQEQKDFLYRRVYRHPDILAKREQTQAALGEMFDRLVTAPDRLPDKFKRIADAEGPSLAVADYLAGMTDRFAKHAFRELTANLTS